MADLTSTVKQLAQVALAGTSAVLYTVPSATSTIVKNIVLCNTNSVAVPVTLNLVPSAGSPAVANTIVSALSLAPGETKVIYLSTVIPTGATIRGFAGTAAVVSATISGVEVA